MAGSGLFLYRWSLPWGDANHLGALAAMGLLLAAGLGASATGLAWRRTASAIASIAVPAAALVLAGSASRGALLAAGAGLLLCLAAGGRRLRWWTVGAAAALAVALLCCPRGAERSLALADPTGDGSLTVRLRLWAAALAAIAEHPWSGLGSDGFAAWWHTWFAGLGETHPRPWPASDVLALACEHGLPLCAAAIALAVAAVATACRCARRDGRPWLTGAAAAVWAGLVADCVSPLLRHPAFALPFAGVALAAAAATVWALRHRSWRISLPPALGGLAAGGAALALIGGTALAVAAALPFRPDGTEGLAARPRGGDDHGTVLMMHGRGLRPGEIGRGLLVPLANAGYAAIAVPPGGAPPAAAERPILIAQGAGLGTARAALAAGLAPRALVLLDADEDAIALLADAAKAPTLAVRGRRDPSFRVPPDPARAATLTLPWGTTWPNRFADAAPAILRWLAAASEAGR